MKLTILGCHSATPRINTNPTSQVLEIKNHSAKYQSDRVAHPGFNQRPISSFRIAQDLKVKIRQCI